MRKLFFVALSGLALTQAQVNPEDVPFYNDNDDFAIFHSRDTQGGKRLRREVFFPPISKNRLNNYILSQQPYGDDDDDYYLTNYGQFPEIKKGHKSAQAGQKKENRPQDNHIMVSHLGLRNPNGMSSMLPWVQKPQSILDILRAKHGKNLFSNAEKTGDPAASESALLGNMFDEEAAKEAQASKAERMEGQREARELRRQQGLKNAEAGRSKRAAALVERKQASRANEENARINAEMKRLAGLVDEDEIKIAQEANKKAKEQARTERNREQHQKYQAELEAFNDLIKLNQDQDQN